jgi:hypothetical protein
MKDEKEIKKVLDKLPGMGITKYSSMTYEQGIEEALLWVIGEIRDSEFEYASIPNDSKVIKRMLTD